MNFISSYAGHIGSNILIGFSGVGRVIILFLEVMKWLGRGLPSRKSLVQQMHFIGVESLPVVLTTGAFTGAVLVYALYPELSRLGVRSWVGPLIAKSLTQQLGPTLSGLMLAGRVGCSMAAELGYMSVSEQIDALKTMGTNPVRYLVLPRVICGTLMTPFLTAFAMFIGISAGLILAVWGLGAEWHYIWEMTCSFMEPFDFFRGLLKAFFFGLTTSLICCYKGMNATGGAEGVGKATTDSNVASCITILMLNLFLTMILVQFA
ncbi:MAG: ABC transporter permease [Planctomycetes bacterium]|nr:ABC transporter permease [Planctomycetota bacterium]